MPSNTTVTHEEAMHRHASTALVEASRASEADLRIVGQDLLDLAICLERMRGFGWSFRRAARRDYTRTHDEQLRTERERLALQLRILAHEARITHPTEQVNFLSRVVELISRIEEE